jgi:hypothetical protein
MKSWTRFAVSFFLQVGKPDGKNHVEEPGIDEDNIKMDLWEVGWGHGLDRYGSG